MELTRKRSTSSWPQSGWIHYLPTSYRYGAVVRSANAYVPPGARKTVSSATPGTVSSAGTPTKPEIPKVSVNGSDTNGAKDAQKPASPAPGGVAANIVSSSRNS